MVLARLAKAPRRTLLPLLPLLLLSAAAGSVRATGLDAVEEHSNVGVEMDEDMLAQPEDAPQGALLSTASVPGDFFRALLYSQPIASFLEAGAMH